jgi:hypothetical protein
MPSSHELVDSNRTFVDGRVMATETTAALMVRALPAVGWEEGERMRVVSAPRCSVGRRYGQYGGRPGGSSW